jgi:ketosteroid isomerase-like protein
VFRIPRKVNPWDGDQVTNESDITQLLRTYERSLNDSDAALAASCYATDAVFMPTTQPTATAGGMREAYERIFSVIHLNVTFTIDELVIASDDIAYALTRSDGTQTVLATDTQSAESNREVFIFGNEDGA